MEAWNPDLHPLDDKPHCSKAFTTIGDWNLAYTAHFIVEERITSRRGRGGTSLTTGWQPHPITPDFSLSVDLGTYLTCRILSVNVADDYDTANDTANYRNRLCAP